MVLFRILVLPMVVIFSHRTDDCWCSNIERDAGKEKEKNKGRRESNVETTGDKKLRSIVLE
jgi:hypothetical protein